MTHRLPFLLVVAAAMMACGDSDEPTRPNSASIGVEDNRFTPGTYQLSAGGTARWSWNGSTSHNVTFDDGPASTTQSTGTYHRTFASAGTYKYHCTVHGAAMSGTVVVAAAAPPQGDGGGGGGSGY